MYLSVDAAGIRRHLELLHREENLANSLIWALSQWRDEVALQENGNIAPLSSQISRISSQRACIRSRIAYLENLRASIIHLKEQTASMLNELM